MFVRRKKTKSGTYHYLVENRRVDGKVRQVVLCYLGEFATVEAALEGLPVLIRQHREKVVQARQRVEQLLKWWVSSGHSRWRPEPQKSGRRDRKTQPNVIWYLAAKEDVQSYTRMADECATRLEQLRSVIDARGAQKWGLESRILGTTSPA